MVNSSEGQGSRAAGSRIRTWLRLSLGFLADLIPDFVWRLLIRLKCEGASRRTPQEALRFLLTSEADLKPFIDRQAIRYDHGVHVKHRLTRYHDFFVSRVRAEERILDVGCGNGAVAYDIAEKTGASVVGIDLNPESIRQALERFPHPRTRYLVGDVLQDLPGERFAAVILSNVLEHLPGRPEFLARLQQAVNPSRMLIRVPLFERDWRVALRRELGIEWRSDPTHETEYTLESFAEEIAAAGLRIVHQEVRWGEIWAVITVN